MDIDRGPPYIRPTCYPAVSGGESVIRLCLGKLLVNQLHVVKRTNTPLNSLTESNRMLGRCASNVDMGPCQPARFWKKSFVVYLKAVALIGLRGHGRGGKRRRGERSLVAAALSKEICGGGLLVREVGVALLLCFYSGRRGTGMCFSRCRNRTRPLNE